jgi:predicted DNA-binding transcriptional regulator AlpA
MSRLFSTDTEHVVFMVPQEELTEAIRSVVSELLAEREEKKKEALLTRKAVSERLNVDNSTLWRWDKANYLKPIRVGKAVYYKESDVKDIEEGRV